MYRTKPLERTHKLQRSIINRDVVSDTASAWSHTLAALFGPPEAQPTLTTSATLKRHRREPILSNDMDEIRVGGGPLRGLGSPTGRLLPGLRTSGRQKGCSGERISPPIPFVVGAGRSGTTLLRLMLDAHPHLAIPPETHFIHRAARRCGRAAEPRRTFLEIVTSHRRWEDFQMEGALLRCRVADIEPFDLGEAVRAFYKLYAERFGKPRWGDKTPPYVHRMTVIQDLLPEARFIHLIRDGRDVALSTLELWFGPDSVEEAAQRWRTLIENARLQSDELSHYLEIRYEDLVLDTEQTLGKISEFVELPWDPAMLAYHERAEERMSELDRDVNAPKDERRVVRGEERKAIHALTSKPPQQDRVSRWKSEMSVADRERFEEIAGETLRGLNYEVA